MALFRVERNPWGQEIVIGLSWDLLWVFAAAGILFVCVDAFVRWRWPKSLTREEDLARLTGANDVAAEVPERVVRHPLPSRLFHWVMAASIFALLITAFLPILGVKFSWVTAHWIAGLVLTGSVLFHIVHSSFWMDLKSMWISRRDIQDAALRFRRALGKPGPEPGKPGKYPLENKLFHHLTAVMSLTVIVTGALMMVKVDTPFWTRNPYFLPDSTWAIIYVLHGLCAVGFVTTITAHIYFAVRPDKWWITRSMIKGWITRKEYLTHHDPAQWPVTGASRRTPGERSPVSAGGVPEQTG